MIQNLYCKSDHLIQYTKLKLPLNLGIKYKTIYEIMEYEKHPNS